MLERILVSREVMDINWRPGVMLVIHSFSMNILLRRSNEQIIVETRTPITKTRKAYMRNI